MSFSYRVRTSDWGLSGITRGWHHVREALRDVRATPKGGTLVIANAGTEVLASVVARSAMRRHLRVIAIDMLLSPQSYQRRVLGMLLRRVDHFICIRRGDIETLTSRFGVDTARCTFVALPAPTEVPPTTEGGYVYAGGQVHRDWSTMFAAAALWKYPSVFAIAPPHAAPDNVACVGAVSPERGRILMADASVVVSGIRDTPLPAGPLVLLDAMAMGKATIATDVRATRDYTIDGDDAVLVPPSNPAAMAAAVIRVMNDDALRKRLGHAARRRAAALTADAFWRAVARAVAA